MVFPNQIIKTIVFVALFTAGPRFCHSQSLTVDQLVRYPRLNAEQLSDSLESKGWKKNSLEFITDSHFVRRTWTIPNRYNNLKSHALLYDFIKDTTENYFIFQYSDPKAFSEYKTLFKKAGFKELTQKSKGKKKRRKNQKNIYEEKEEIFYNEKLHSVVQMKEIFVYGMFSYVIYSYKSNSGIGKNVLQETGNKIPNIQD